MRTKVLVVIAAVTAFMALGAASALAANQQVNGQGQTALSASLGFNAKADLSGQMNYNADPNGVNAGFSAHCSGYTSYAQDTTGRNGYPRVKLMGTCTDKDGVTVYMRASFVDRGEPGTFDSECITFSYTDPAVKKNIVVHDMGYIQNGNIQIHG